MKIVEKSADQVSPLCPHCSEVLAEVWSLMIFDGLEGTGYFYVCPHCNKVLGTTVLGTYSA